MRDQSYEKRLEKNDKSRSAATHHREPWSADEVAFLLDWDGTDEELGVMAECLGRTREACRERYYKVRRGETTHVIKNKGGIHQVVTSTTTHTEPYVGSQDDPDDCWWSPDYYRK